MTTPQQQYSPVIQIQTQTYFVYSCNSLPHSHCCLWFPMSSNILKIFFPLQTDLVLAVNSLIIEIFFQCSTVHTHKKHTRPQRKPWNVFTILQHLQLLLCKVISSCSSNVLAGGLGAEQSQQLLVPLDLCTWDWLGNCMCSCFGAPGQQSGQGGFQELIMNSFCCAQLHC